MAEEMTTATWEEIEKILEEHMVRFANAYQRLAGGSYLTAEQYPALAKLWDNKDDEIYDEIAERNAWLSLSESSLAEDWDSPEDSIYDNPDRQEERERIAEEAARELIEEIKKKWKPIPDCEKERLVHHVDSEPDD
jgi:hypothetical protein